MVTRSILRRVLPLVLYCTVPAAAQTASGKGTLVGFVIVTPGDAPLPGAAVQLDTTEWRTVADSQGRFELDSVDAGTYVLHIRAVGYDEGAWRVRLHSDQVTTHAFALAQQVVELPGVAVKGRLPLSARRYVDFERRRQTASGAFFTQEDIEKVNPAALVDILVTVRGVQQVCLVNDCVAKMVRSPPGCYPQYYIDGIESTAYFARHTPPKDIKGIEIYRGESEIPGEFGGSNSACGVIAIWTKSSP
jgi:carboxypeptidase-like protein